MKYYRNIRSLITPKGNAAQKGSAMGDVATVKNAAIVTDDNGRIIFVGEEQSDKKPYEAAEVIDCKNLLVLPGFVDSHTHAVFAGERSNEFCMRAEGKSYQEIAAIGGGIRASVSQTRGATLDEIVKKSARYLRSALALGTTTMEVKSGYGLSLESEIKLLEAIRILKTQTPLELVATWLGAHAVPTEKSKKDYIKELIEQQLPAVVASNLAEFADVFCDEGYYTNYETELICKAAEKAGLKIRLHCDELADTSGAELAVKLGSYSADHLLKINQKGIEALASSERTIATLLPITAMCIREPYAPARKMISAGCAVAIATDCNPGSSMSENMQLAVSLAVIGMGMSPEEALTAATLNGAVSLGLGTTHGTVEIGKYADFVLYDIPSLAFLPYHIGVSDVVAVVKHGSIVSGTL